MTDFVRDPSNHWVKLNPLSRQGFARASRIVVTSEQTCGLPVVCTDLGRPGRMGDETRGRVIPTAVRSRAEVVSAHAAAFGALSGDDKARRDLSLGALKRASHYSWKNVVDWTYWEVEAENRQAPIS